MPKPTYFDRLKQHPGVPVASMMTVIGGFAGASNESMSLVVGFVFGACIFAAVTWPIVLWTARTQPVEQGAPAMSDYPWKGKKATYYVDEINLIKRKQAEAVEDAANYVVGLGDKRTLLHYVQCLRQQADELEQNQ